ncbi:MAG: glycerol kinase GlpK, partial [bacterium]
AYKEFPQYFPKPGWVEHDPEEIWDSVYWTIQQVLKKIKPSSIAAIGITNQRETTVIWDRNSGKPVHNAIVWQCRRTADRCQELKRKWDMESYIKKKTGLPIDAYFSGTKIEWILKKIKDQKLNIKYKELCFGTTDSWILWKLTGGKVHATDHTNASRTMLYDIGKREWDKKITRILNIPLTMLPKVQDSSGYFGETVKIGKLVAGIPITGIAGDQQAALFGQTCFEPGTMKNTYGTGCFVLLNSGKVRPSSKHGLITTLACDAKGKPVFALEGSIFIAGAAIQWLRDGLKIISKASDSQKLASSLPDNAGVYFVPAFVGLGAPYWDQNARGTIVGLTRGVKREHLVRAALEAMCYGTKDVIKVMEKDTGLNIRDLKVDGGAVINDFLCQFQSDILGCSVVRPKIIETTSLGAAYLAGLAVGLYKDASEIKRFWKRDRSFAPKMPKEKAKGYYQGWQKAIKKTLTS